MTGLQRVLAKEIVKSIINKREENINKFSKWFIPLAKTRVVRKEECANFIAKLTPERDITNGQVCSFISEAKRIVERELGVTIWNIHGEGWRIASKLETAVVMYRSAKKTVRYAERTADLYSLTDKKHLPEALKKVFNNSPKAQRELTEYNSKFKKLFKSESFKSIA